MSKTEIRSEIDGTIATLTFSTPGDRVNALTPDLQHSFGAALARLKQNSNIRSTIVAADSSKSLPENVSDGYGPAPSTQRMPSR